MAKAQLPNFFDPHLILEDLSQKEKIQFSHIIEGQDFLNLTFADVFAKKLKSWARQKGVSHYSYWFLPSACLASEKQDAILSWKSDCKEIEQLKGSDLIHAGIDISWFSSLDLPSHLFSSGVLSLDVSSRPFILEGPEQSLTLWIPSLFSSAKGEPLDLKIPLLKSVEKLKTAVLRLQKICGIPRHELAPHLEIKQNFYVLDRELVDEFPGLALTGRAVYEGRFNVPESQHWNCRLHSFIHEVEEASSHIGNEIKISHLETGRLQFEGIAKNQKAALAIDVHVILMEIMRQIGLKHGVVSLFSEKPFISQPASEKYLKWSLINQDGSKLNDLVLWVLVTAMIHALYEHQDLFHASFSYMKHDMRLGASKGLSLPLAIDLGKGFSQVLHRLLLGEPLESTEMNLDMIVKEALLPGSFSDAFCRFSGSGFEFRGLSASAYPSFAVCVIQSAMADSLQLFVDEISDEMGRFAGRSLFDCMIPVLRKHLKDARRVIWDDKSNRSHSKICYLSGSFDPLIDQKAIRTFENVMSSKDLQRLRSIYLEQYVRTIEAELHLMIHHFRMKILPALNAYSNEKKIEFSHLLHDQIEQVIIIMADLDKLQEQMLDLGVEARAKVLTEIGIDKMTAARFLVDQLGFK